MSINLNQFSIYRQQFISACFRKRLMAIELWRYSVRV